ncbi:MAG: AraC family transcriptional regulator [Sphingobacteriales bacterium]|nr:MAG: AraC family transcriptional regulator [Sphingobacteriales bacterium]
MVTYYTIPPPKHLQKYVRFFWVFEMKHTNAEPYIYRSMADGCTEIIFHYKGEFIELDTPGNGRQGYSLIHGQSQQYRRFITNDDFGIFGAYLYPYASPALFNMPAHALTNEMPDLQTLLGAEGVILEEQIMLAKTNQQRAVILSTYIEKWLLKNNVRHMPIHRSVLEVIQKKGMVNIPKLASDYCLSERQFQRKFKELSGFSPKVYSRINRFQHVMAGYGNLQQSLTHLAYDFGYYDQSHFIQDFKQFSGYTPAQYFNGRPEGVEYREA